MRNFGIGHLLFLACLICSFGCLDNVTQNTNINDVYFNDSSCQQVFTLALYKDDKTKVVNCCIEESLSNKKILLKFHNLSELLDKAIMLSEELHFNYSPLSVEN